jgi:hypothetical protein
MENTVADTLIERLIAGGQKDRWDILKTIVENKIREII